MTLLPEDFIQLLLAILIGGLIGAEREYRDKAAGFRTTMLICVGATIFTNFSVKLGGGMEPTWIAASIVTGMGFLGAVAILRGSGHVTGLTAASPIWLAAALGMGIGGGAVRNLGGGDCGSSNRSLSITSNRDLDRQPEPCSHLRGGVPSQRRDTQRDREFVWRERPPRRAHQPGQISRSADL